ILVELMQGWCIYKKFKEDNKWSKLLKAIRTKRNEIIHKGESITSTKIGNIWANNDFSGVYIPTTSENIKNLMTDTFKEISTPPNLNNLLMRSLYQWGLQYLEDAN
ncbi:MAG: hypothetical protein ACKPJ4_18310, partial [Dolichospermum sp.]